MAGWLAGWPRTPVLTCTTHLYDFEGRRFLLPQLDDRRLDDPYAEVSELCLAAAPRRSLSWERQPNVEDLILHRTARRKGWSWGL
ncbi:hypothetical protein ABZT17_29920 [Streptomyces sp. NPDC005648]|uniref:hypothetical protein n=1 Tax=Streptomyces sp. NPDC005648 TaxID=3157044 RepID=UPI0033A90CC5